MDRSLQLAEIADLCRLAPRKLRYVLDHELLPGGKVASRGRGAVRHFTRFEAFGLAIAVWMLDAGLRRALVRDCLASLCGPPGADVAKIPLFRAYQSNGKAKLEVGDWAYTRLMADGLVAMPLDTGWLPLAGATPPTGPYEPLVTLTLDVAQVRGRISAQRFP